MSSAFNVNREDLAWAGGFFEGEGCFTLRKATAARVKVPVATVVSIANTDEDTLRKLHKIIGVGNVNGPYCRPNRKLLWQWQTNKFEHSQHVVATLWPWLGQRRREAATKMLKGMHEARSVLD